MKLYRIALAGAFVTVGPSSAVAAPQPITVPPGQVIKACAPIPAVRSGVVCAKNIEVRGGAPVRGYSFAAQAGTTLPPGIALTTAGIVTATRVNNPPLRARSAWIRFTVSDGARSRTDRVMLQMDTSPSCSCPGLTAGFGQLPDALGGQPYGVALPVSGPPSNQTAAPVYTWRMICNGINPSLCSLPPRVTLNSATGVLS